VYGHTGAEAMAKAGSCGVSEAEARPDAAFATDPHNPVFFCLYLCMTLPFVETCGANNSPNLSHCLKFYHLITID